MVVCLELLRVNDKTYRNLVTNLEVDFFLRFRCFPELVWICDEVGVFDKATTISQIEYWVASSHAKFKFSLQIIEKRTVNSSQKIRFYKSLDFSWTRSLFLYLISLESVESKYLFIEFYIISAYFRFQLSSMAQIDMIQNFWSVQLCVDSHHHLNFFRNNQLGKAELTSRVIKVINKRQISNYTWV